MQLSSIQKWGILGFIGGGVPILEDRLPPTRGPCGGVVVAMARRLGARGGRVRRRTAPPSAPKGAAAGVRWWCVLMKKKKTPRQRNGVRPKLFCILLTQQTERFCVRLLEGGVGMEWLRMVDPL